MRRPPQRIVSHLGSKKRGYKKHAGPPNTRLDDLRISLDLSVRDLANICGGSANGVSKTTLAYLLNGTISDEMLHKLKPKVLDGLRHFLSKHKHWSKARIEEQLKDILERPDVPFTLTDEQLDELTTWGMRLDAFRRHYRLSYDTIADICGRDRAWGISRSTFQRISAGGQKDSRFAARIKPLAAEGLRRFLTQKGRTTEEIEAELSLIFDDQEIEMFAQRTTLKEEVLHFFGLKRDPFTGDPRSAEEVFTTRQLDKIAEQIEDAINYQGMLAVIGDIGSGKTILKRRTMETVKKSDGKMRLLFPEFFNMDRVHTGSISAFFLRAFGQRMPHDLVARAEKIRDILEEQSTSGVRVALCFDECHHLDDRVLTALKNFWEMGSGGYDRYLGIVLFGQPQFKFRLQEEDFREIFERLEVVEMPNYKKCAYDYLKHRLKFAGGDIDRLFERKAIDILARQVDTPLALGNLANVALLKAYIVGQKKVLAAFLNDPDDEPRVRAIRQAK
ncbi:MAG: AAA family ATPase [Pyrinomonadaceae bacterium]|nr:AAA family ATPase [Pyrinomonadaceae bacterium]